MGGAGRELAFASSGPTVILMAGLQGSGKTTACAKLAKLLGDDGKKVGARRLRHPAPGGGRAAGDDGQALGRDGLRAGHGAQTRWTSPSGRSARRAPTALDVLIVDTAGRLHVDEELMERAGRDPRAR